MNQICYPINFMEYYHEQNYFKYVLYSKGFNSYSHRKLIIIEKILPTKNYVILVLITNFKLNLAYFMGKVHL